jgi:hypothetical protein
MELSKKKKKAQMHYLNKESYDKDSSGEKRTYPGCLEPIMGDMSPRHQPCVHRLNFGLIHAANSFVGTRFYSLNTNLHFFLNCIPRFAPSH